MKCHFTPSNRSIETQQAELRPYKHQYMKYDMAQSTYTSHVQEPKWDYGHM
jgi:hypothetical protein